MIVAEKLKRGGISLYGILDLMQPSLFASVQWTVSALTKYIRDLLEGDVTLQDVWVQGEISNLSRPASGHIYFTLKDAGRVAAMCDVADGRGAAQTSTSRWNGN